MEVELTDGHYGEFTVLVDGQEILRGGKLAFLGVLPSVQSVRDVIERVMRADNT